MVLTSSINQKQCFKHFQICLVGLTFWVAVRGGVCERERLKFSARANLIELKKFKLKESKSLSVFARLVEVVGNFINSQYTKSI